MIEEIEVNELIEQADKTTAYHKIEEVIKLIRQYYLLPDPNVVKIIMACVVAYYLNTDPLWIFLIAPPSSMKTELISALDDIPNIYQLSSLTSQTIFSGLRKRKDQAKDNALLLKIKNKIFTLKDFGSVLSMRWEDKSIILAQLREIYDGSYHARYGNGVEIDWKGKIGLICGVTQIIDTHYSIFQVLGERFIQYRLRATDPEKLSNVAIASIGKEKEARQKLKMAFSAFFNSLSVPSIDKIILPEKIKEKIVSLACLVVKARSGVVRDSYKKTLEYIPDPEAPARLVKQLVTLAYSLAIVNRRKTVNIKDYSLVLKVGLDCIPKQRLLILNFLRKNPEQQFTTSEISEGINYSTEGARIHLEDLNAHGVINVDKGHTHRWSLSAKTKQYFEKIILRKKMRS